MGTTKKVTIEEPVDELVEEEAEDLLTLPEDVQADDESQPELEDDDILTVEDMDDDEELFEGGPIGRQLKAWKSQFGEIYVTSFDFDTHVVWRTLNRFEYRRLVKTLEQSLASGSITQGEANLNNEEAICELCVLFPTMSRADNISFPAGMATTIAQEIMEASAFVPMEVRRL